MPYSPIYRAVHSSSQSRIPSWAVPYTNFPRAVYFPPQGRICTWLPYQLDWHTNFPKTVYFPGPHKCPTSLPARLPSLQKKKLRSYSIYFWRFCSEFWLLLWNQWIIKILWNYWHFGKLIWLVTAFEKKNFLEPSQDAYKIAIIL